MAEIKMTGMVWNLLKNDNATLTSAIVMNGPIIAAVSSDAPKDIENLDRIMNAWKLDYARASIIHGALLRWRDVDKIMSSEFESVVIRVILKLCNRNHETFMIDERIYTRKNKH